MTNIFMGYTQTGLDLLHKPAPSAPPRETPMNAPTPGKTAAP